MSIKKNLVNTFVNYFDFHRRQDSLFNEMNNASIMVIAGNSISFRSNDTTYLYRPNSNILYLTGFEEPECYLVLLKKKEKNGDKVKKRCVLFVRPKDPEKETWTGRRLGPNRTKKMYSVDEAYTSEEFKSWFEENSKEFNTIYSQLNQNKIVDELVFRLYENSPYVTIENPLKILSRLRTYKDEIEAELVKKACDISAEAHLKLMKTITTGMPELKLEQLFLQEIMIKGAKDVAYSSICASGDNATILHYVENNDTCKDGELVLIDAGCEYHYYASDITRTFPVNGKFSDLQKKIYDIVLKTQKMAISMCTIGNTWDEVNKATIKSLTEGLISLGILSGDIEALIKDEKYKPFFMHSFGHSLGLDTHDPSNLRCVKSGEKVYPPFKAGLVITVEPGLYFSSTQDDIPEEFKGIGIRIEDDVLITENGPVVLTEKVPKEITDIEALVNSS